VNKLEVLSDVMNHMINLNSVRYDYLIDLDVTAPLRKKYDIYNALEKISYNNTNSKNLFSVVKARRIPWFNQVIIYDNNKVGYSSDFNFFKYPTGVFDMNASIYIYAAEFFSYPFSSPILENSILYEMEEWTAFDIDTQTDFEIAEMFFKKYILDYKNE
jgi:CMP-N-acetylneuraminic acid synthetase